MDINSIGIGSLISSILIVATNIYIFQKNRKFDQSKEQINNLYNPLHEIIEKEYKHIQF